MTQDINGKVTNSQSYTTNESKEVNPFQAGDRKAQINRCAQRHNKHKAEKTYKIHKRSTAAALGRTVKNFTGGLKQVSWRQPQGHIVTYHIPYTYFTKLTRM